MNQEPHPPQNEPTGFDPAGIDPELEARIVALVLGEASDFETAALESLIERRGELAALKQRIESVHQLLREGVLKHVATGEAGAEQDDWKLPDEQRSALLSVIDGAAAGGAEVDPVGLDGAGPVRIRADAAAAETADRAGLKFSRRVMSLARIAALLLVVGIVASVLLLPAKHDLGNWRIVASKSTPADSAEPKGKPASAYGRGLAGRGGANGSDPHGVPADVAEALRESPGDLVTLGDLSGTTLLRGQVRPRSQQINSAKSLAAIGNNLQSYQGLQIDRSESENLERFLGTDGRTAPRVFNSGIERLTENLFESPADVADPFSDVEMGTRFRTQPPRSKAELSSPELGEGDGDRFAGTSAEPKRPATPVAASSLAAGEMVEQLALGGLEQQVAETRAEVAKSAEESFSSENRFAESREAFRGQGQRLRSDAAPGLDNRSAATLDVENFIDTGAASWPDVSRPEQQYRERPLASYFNGGGRGGNGILTFEMAPIEAEQAGQVAGVEAVAGSESNQVVGNVLTNESSVRSGVRLGTLEETPQGVDFLLGAAAKQPSNPAGNGRGGGLGGGGGRFGGGSDANETLKVKVNPVADLVLPVEAPHGVDSDGDAGGGRYGGYGGEYGGRRLGKEADRSNVNAWGFAEGKRAAPLVPAAAQSVPNDRLAREKNLLAAIRTEKKLAAAAIRDFRKGTAATIRHERKVAAAAIRNEITAEDEAFSTFSLHVSDVSFKLAQAALAKGEWPDQAKIRIEEFVNAFDYDDPTPSQTEKVACRLEQSIHPFLQQRNMLRVSMRTAAEGRAGDTPLRLTLLLDNSGSMERPDRHATMLRALELLTAQLQSIDQVTLISFARQPHLLADKISGDQAGKLVQLADTLPSEGGTNLEAALQLAFEKAQEQQVDGGQNRIILLTDGAANLGDAEPESLSRLVASMRSAGIAFDAAGISADGLNDEILEALTRRGDGRYYLLDQPSAADAGFARQIAGALRPAAKNVKVQIEFNPKRVGRYQLLGFEKHRLEKQDFRNDQVDAAEMAAAEAGVAVYQFEPKPHGEGDVGSVSVRFRDMSTGQMIENRWPIPYEANAPRCEQAAPSLRLATVAALLAAKLGGDPLGATVDWKTASSLIADLPERYRTAKRVQQLQQMIDQMRQVSGE